MTDTNRTTLWTVGLASAFILTLSLADVAATKFVELGGVVMPGGVFLFAILFVVRDTLHKVAGAKLVRQVIRIGVGLNVAVGLYLFVITLLPAPGFRPSDAFDSLFGLAPGIVIGSVVAAFTSQMVNTAVYQRLWERGLPQWVRSVGSNAVSLPVDAVLFTFVGFVLIPPLLGADGIGLDAAFARVASGQTLVKALVMLAATPLIYAAPTNDDALAAK